jgi:hypothetical protein
MEEPDNPLLIEEDVELAPDAEVPEEVEESLRREREEEES